MRILVLGGARHVGSGIVSKLAASKVISNVVIGDGRKGKAEEAAARIGSNKVSAEVADVNDTETLTRLMGDVDIVVNTVRPFYVHAAKVLSAAIEAKVDYVDVCDDYDATADLLKLDKHAKGAGITALINMGLSPGLINVLAKYGADKLDQVDEIRIAWAVPFLGGTGGAEEALHGFHELTGNVPQFVGGKWVDVPAGSGKETIAFADGEAECVYLGHPEPVTLPRYIKGVKVVTNKGGLMPFELMQDMITLTELGFGSNEPIRTRKDTYAVPREVALAVHSQYLEEKGFKDSGKPWGGTRVDVKGKKGDTSVCYTYTSPPGASWMLDVDGGSAAISAASVILMLARKDIKEKGVIAPEGCIEPKTFLSELRKAGIEICETESVNRKLERF